MPGAVIAYNCGLVADNLSLAGAPPPRLEKACGLPPDQSGKSGLEKTQKDTTEANMLLKTKDGKTEFGNEAKKYLKTKVLCAN